MGWSFRKSVGAGPFRINFSKSGVSYSFGVKGARINTGPRGTYVNFGSNGIYYHKKIYPAPKENYIHPEEHPEAGIQQHTITSGPIEQLTDAESQDFVTELNEKSGKSSYLNTVGIPLAILFIAALFFYYNQVVDEKSDYQYYVTTQYGHEGINIRKEASPASEVLGKASPFMQYDVIDSADGWYQIRYEDRDGSSTAFISAQFAQVDSSFISKTVTTRMQKDGGRFAGSLGSGLTVCALLCFFLHKRDRKRLSMEIEYQLDDKVQEMHDRFLDLFSEGASSERVWQIIHSERTSDWKRNSGASKLVNRINTGGIYLDKKPTSFFKTNIQIPSLQLRGTALYFFPERLLIRKNRQFAAVFYKNLDIDEHTTRFIEDGSVPQDAVVEDYTWRYVNKNGGPDRRFNDNRRLPICRYSYFTFTSGSGVYETICTSKIGAFSRFAQLIELIGQFQQDTELAGG